MLQTLVKFLVAQQSDSRVLVVQTLVVTIAAGTNWSTFPSPLYHKQLLPAHNKMIISFKYCLDCSPYQNRSNTPSISFRDIIVDFLQLLYYFLLLSRYLQVRVGLREKTNSKSQWAQCKIHFRRLVSGLLRTTVIAFLREQLSNWLIDSCQIWLLWKSNSFEVSKFGLLYIRSNFI